MEKENNFMAELLKFQDEENEKFKVDSINRLKSIYSQIIKLKTDRESAEDNFRSNLLAFFNKCRHRFDVVSYGVFSVTVERIWENPDLDDEKQHELKLYESCKYIMQNIRDANTLLGQYRRTIFNLNDRRIYVNRDEYDEDQYDIDVLIYSVPTKSGYVLNVYTDENSEVSCNIRDCDLQYEYGITLNTHNKLQKE